jgi:hypothetical protein
MRDDARVTSHTQGSGPVSCVWCGRTVDDVPVTWTVQSGPRGVEHLCEQCTRTNVRQIESQLAAEYW